MIEKHEEFWILFPIVGLEIIDENPRFDAWLTNDFTIISKKHYSSIGNFFKNPNPYGGEILKMNSLIYDSYFGIKLQKTNDLSLTDRSYYEKAYAKARYYESILAVTFLVHNGSPVTFRLCGDHEPPIRNARLLDFNSGTIGSGGVGGQREHIFIINGLGSLKYNYEEITRLVFHEYFPIGEILFKRSIHKSIGKSIEAGIIRLSESILNTDHVTKLLEAAITIEALLSNGSTRSATLLNRLTVVLENDWHENINRYEELIKARNEFVHSGVVENAKSISIQSVELAIALFINFVYYVRGFKNKTEFLDSIDMTYMSKRVSNCKLDFGNLFSADRETKKNILKELPHYDPMIKTSNY